MCTRVVDVLHIFDVFRAADRAERLVLDRLYRSRAIALHAAEDDDGKTETILRQEHSDLFSLVKHVILLEHPELLDPAASTLAPALFDSVVRRTLDAEAPGWEEQDEDEEKRERLYCARCDIRRRFVGLVRIPVDRATTAADLICANLSSSDALTDVLGELKQQSSMGGQAESRKIGMVFCPSCYTSDIGAIPHVQGLENFAAVTLLAEFS